MGKLLVKIIIVLALLLGGVVWILWCGDEIAKGELLRLPEYLAISAQEDGRELVRTCIYKGKVVYEEREEALRGPYEYVFQNPWDTARLVAALQEDGYTVTPGEPGELLLSRRDRRGLFTVDFRISVQLSRSFEFQQLVTPYFLGIPLHRCSNYSKVVLGGSGYARRFDGNDGE